MGDCLPALKTARMEITFLDDQNNCMGKTPQKRSIPLFREPSRPTRNNNLPNKTRRVSTTNDNLFVLVKI